jgi:hypothetical protein
MFFLFGNNTKGVIMKFRSFQNSMGRYLSSYTARLLFLILMVIAFAHFLENALRYAGWDVMSMVTPAKLLLLSYNTINYNGNTIMALIQIYPVIVTIPAGFMYLKEQQRGTYVYLSSRIGCKTYLYHHIAASFFTTTVIFMVPFLFELLLTYIAFPAEATLDLTYWKGLDLNRVAMERGYYMGAIYRISPCLYAMTGTILFGLFSGLLGAFTTALSFVFRFPYKILLMLPAFLLLNGTVILQQLTDRPFAWYHYLLLFAERAELTWYLPAFMGLLAAVTLILTAYASKKDCL